MDRASCALLRLLRDPGEAVDGYSLRDWDLAVRQARWSVLLPKLAVTLRTAGLMEAVPAAPRRHLASAETMARRHRASVRREIDAVHAVLWSLGVPVMVLKGGAYVAAELPCAAGRLFADVDILVPRAALEDVEARLLSSGWASETKDPYDQRYYRQWMHEIPPLVHVRRRTVLDVHHTILPPTCRLSPDPAKLLAAASAISGYEDLYVPSPEDLVLHSAAHLFHDGELAHGLRDLVDLHELLGEFGREAAFWTRLAERAREMDLALPLAYGLRYAARFVGTCVPDAVAGELLASSPAGWRGVMMDALFERGLSPDHPSCDDRFTASARWLLFVRAHWLRMPPHLLVPHLARKGYRRLLGADEQRERL